VDPRRARPASSAAARPPTRASLKPASRPTRSVAHARPATASARGRGAATRAADTPTTSSDLRRLAPALLSAVVPGLGQALNGRRRLARRLALP